MDIAAIEGRYVIVQLYCSIYANREFLHWAVTEEEAWESS